MKSGDKTRLRVFIFIFLALPLFASACNEKQQLSASDLKIAAGDLRTLAFASGRLTQQFANGQLTQIFFENQTELLLEKVHNTAQQLDGFAEEPEHEKERFRLVDIAERLHTALEKSQSGDVSMAEDLIRLGAEAKDIEDRFKEEQRAASEKNT